MAQWLYLIGALAILLLAWKFAVRPWLEKRAGPPDERRLGSRTAAKETRSRRRSEGEPFV